MPNRPTRRAFGYLAISCLALNFPGGASNDQLQVLELPGGAPTWRADSDLAGAHMGAALASAGDVNGDGFDDIIVGAPNEGRVYVFHGSAQGPAAQPAWTADGLGSFGASVSTAGDVNGDGFDDVIVGAPDATTGALSASGRASVYLGSLQGPATAPTWTVQGSFSGERLGASVASAGDVNGDGYGDIIVGATAGPGTEAEGHALLFLGSAGGLATTPVWNVTSTRPFANSLFGAAVAGAGDVNGDGFDDVLVGQPEYQATTPLFQCEVGYAFVYFGSPQGLGTTPGWGRQGDGICSDLLSTHFGCSLGAADVNGDHFTDILIGCSLKGSLLFLGSSNGPASSPSWNAPGFAHGAGDVDGDLRDDIIVGVPGFSNGEAGEGSTSLYLGDSSGLSTIPAWTVEGGQAGTSFGAAVAGAGDTDGDGLANVLVGAPNFDDGEIDEGAAFHFFGRIVVSCVTDADGDRYCASGPAADCDDSNSSIHPNAPESCNGRDDDCDGAVDEAFGVGTACNSGVGACASPGVTACAADGTAFCNAPPRGQPSTELCDGLDNDCDGQVDEENPGGGVPCDTGLPGVCAAGGTVCQGGSLHCVPYAQLPYEICDGLDNDCNGSVDEIFYPDVCGTCETWLPGRCSIGTRYCQDGHEVCPPCFLPEEETCNGLDDDCDGSVDEDAEKRPLTTSCYSGPAGTAGVGQCHAGVSTCTNGVIGACVGQTTPVPEVCNGLDDNCNGIVDEGFGPVMMAIDLSPSVLWPANHRMVDIHAAVSVSGGCRPDGSAPAVILSSVTSNEPDDATGSGDGQTVNDIQGADLETPDFDLQLRAERDETRDGRVYTLVYTTTDQFGNTRSATAHVVVLRDQGRAPANSVSKVSPQRHH